MATETLSSDTFALEFFCDQGFGHFVAQRFTDPRTVGWDTMIGERANLKGDSEFALFAELFEAFLDQATSYT